MAPWNATVILGVRSIATPLACGNTVAMKTSELCPRTDALVILNAAALDHVTPDMRIYTEESFGPIVAIIRAQSVDEAVRISNDSEFGLYSAVFGRDRMRAMAVARRIESGICHINGPTVHDEAHMPFGGVKSSGYGRFGGIWGVTEFTELRWITMQDGAMHYPI
jgi:acyl-CoA reductase-like NAD-dependent aldehyde dehydrogenase